MTVRPLAANEAVRLAALARLRLIGTPAEERLDAITRMARRAFGVPIAAIDLVDSVKVWVKSAQGIDITEGARDTSYCQHAIADGDLVVPDTLLDPRFADNPHAPHLRFYAGAALRSDGQPVGVMCIADSEPRMLSADQCGLLRDMADMVERELAITRLTEHQLLLAQENEALLKRALVDGLTHAWNRTAILELCQTELASRTADRPLSVLMIDADHFKRVNDTHGHAGGDEVLREIATRLRQGVRPLDAVGRYGGEEFLVVLPTCPYSDLMRAAERVRRAVSERPVSFDGGDIPVTVSVGAATAGDDETAEQLIKRADYALYRAKHAGRNRACVEDTR